MNDDFWDQNAKAWIRVIREKGIPSREVTSPALIQTLTQLSPRRVLDVGCGEGWLAGAIAACLPNAEYFGIDGSQGLIQAAQARHPQHRFERLSYAELAGQPDLLQSVPFDAAIFNFALFDQNLVPVLNATRSQIRPVTGRIIIQTLPPAPEISVVRSEDFKSMSEPFQGQWEWFHRTREDWMHQLDQSGLRLESEQFPRDPETQAECSWIMIVRPK